MIVAMNLCEDRSQSSIEGQMTLNSGSLQGTYREPGYFDLSDSPSAIHQNAPKEPGGLPSLPPSLSALHLPPPSEVENSPQNRWLVTPSMLSLARFGLAPSRIVTPFQLNVSLPSCPACSHVALAQPQPRMVHDCPPPPAARAATITTLKAQFPLWTLCKRCPDDRSNPPAPFH